MPGPQTEAVWAWIDVKEANMDFCSGSVVRNLPTNTVDMGLITGWGQPQEDLECEVLS